MASQYAVELIHVSYSYGTSTEDVEEIKNDKDNNDTKNIKDANDTEVVQDLNLCIAHGEWAALVGGSGSGKSTLAGLLTGYLPRVGGGTRSGAVFIHGNDPATAQLNEIAPKVSIVVQDPYGALVLGRVEDEVSLGPENLCFSVSEVKEYTTQALTNMDLIPLRESEVSLLSGGQRQRTTIASILSMHTDILFFDESSSHLDQASRKKLLQVLDQLAQQGRTIITLSGRMDEVALLAPRLIVMDQGKIVMDGPARQIMDNQAGELVSLGLLPSVEIIHSSLEASDAGVSVGTSTVGATPSIRPRENRATEDEAIDNRATEDKLLLQLKNFSFAYRKRHPLIFQDVNVELYQGQWIMLSGANGAGKTTLSKLLTGLLPVPKGQMFWQGRDIAKWSIYDFAKEIGYVFQQPEQQFVTHTVLDELLYSPRSILGLSVKEETPIELLQRAEEMLGFLGLTQKREMSPYLLSGGEKRLLSVAAIMMLPRKLYILDEPTAGLDYIGVQKLIYLCRKAIGDGASILMITHEPILFAEENIKVWHIEGGKIS